MPAAGLRAAWSIRSSACARADARRGTATDRRRRIQVVPVDHLRAERLAHLGHGAQRHHPPRAAAHFQPRMSVGPARYFCSACTRTWYTRPNLLKSFTYAAPIEGLERREHGGERHVEHLDFFAVDVDENLRHAGAEAGVHVCSCDCPLAAVTSSPTPWPSAVAPRRRGPAPACRTRRERRGRESAAAETPGRRFLNGAEGRMKSVGPCIASRSSPAKPVVHAWKVTNSVRSSSAAVFDERRAADRKPAPTPAVSASTSSICLSTLRVRLLRPPSGSDTDTSAYPWSSTGKKPVGTCRYQ